MSRQPRVILFELNEVPLTVLNDYAERRPQSTIAEFLRAGNTYETLCPDTIALDPWISWPTLHRGVRDVTHGVLHLGQKSRTDLTYPAIWKRLVDEGIPTGVFGSLHSSSDDPTGFSDYRFFIPDYFTTSNDAFPSFMKGFQGLNIKLTRASARNVSKSIPATEAARAIGSFVALGLSRSTAKAIFKQLIDERSAPWMKVRRRNIQSAIMGDLFLRLVRRTNPSFATFYTNNVAAAMHRFWSANYPASFDTNMDQDWIAQYRDEIFIALDVVDETLSTLAAELKSGDQILVTSSMGQGPIPFERTAGYQIIGDIDGFMTAVGMDQDSWQEKPAMVPCRSISFRDTEALQQFNEAIKTVRVDDRSFVDSDKPIGPASYSIDPDGLFAHIFVHAEGAVSPTINIDGTRISAEVFGLEFLPYDDGVNNTAQHIPEGSLLVYPGVPAPDQRVRKVSSLDIAPSILAFFGVTGLDHLPGADTIQLDADHQIDLRAKPVDAEVVDLPAIASLRTKDLQ